MVVGRTGYACHCHTLSLCSVTLSHELLWYDARLLIPFPLLQLSKLDPDTKFRDLHHVYVVNPVLVL